MMEVRTQKHARRLLLRETGAQVQDLDGKTPVELAKSEEVQELLKSPETARA